MQPGDPAGYGWEPRILAEPFIGMLRGFHQPRALLGTAPVSATERCARLGSCGDFLLRAG